MHAIDLIRSGSLGRRQSVDILDDLDFDFLNGMKTDLDVVDAFNDDFMFDFSADNQYGSHNSSNSVLPHNHAAHAALGGVHANGGGNGGFTNLKTRTASVDSTGSFSFFENLPYDANNANSLMDELQFLNSGYGESASAPYYGTGRQISPTNRGEAIKQQAAGNQQGNTGAPHVSFSRFVSSIGGLDPAGLDEAGQGMGQGYGASNISGHKGRRDSWDIAAQYIQQEEDFSRGNGSGGSRHTVGATGSGTAWATAQLQHQLQHQALAQQKGAAGSTTAGSNANKPGVARKVSIPCVCSFYALHYIHLCFIHSHPACAKSRGRCPWRNGQPQARQWQRRRSRGKQHPDQEHGEQERRRVCLLLWRQRC